MARQRKVGLKVRVSDDTAFVSTTDVRTNFNAIVNRVLKKYPTVMVERNGTPVAAIMRPEAAETDMKVEEF